MGKCRNIHRINVLKPIDKVVNMVYHKDMKYLSDDKAESIVKETRELNKLLAQIIERAEAMKYRLDNENRDSNSLGGILIPSIVT